MVNKVRFVSQFVQADIKRKYGLWGVYDSDDGQYLVLGDKGKMNKIAKLLNEPS